MDQTESTVSVMLTVIEDRSTNFGVFNERGMFPGLDGSRLRPFSKGFLCSTPARPHGRLEVVARD
jgi:hypothetical protein